MIRSVILFLLLFITFTSCYMGSRQTQSVVPQFNSNKVIAHRGAWKNTKTPQNSMASLEEAFRLGCEGTEFDIRMTADEILILNHDADHQGMDIEKSTYAELKAKPLINGESLPLLEDIIKRGIRQQQTKLVAEIKPSPAGKERSLILARKVVEMFRQLKAENWVVYISFDYDILKKVKEMVPDASVQYLNGDKSPEQLKADGMDADYHFSVFQKDSSWIQRAHTTGIVVNAWTVNDTLLMDKLLGQGIDLLTTDEPEKLLQRVGK